MTSAVEIQEEVRKFWDNKPCGSDLSTKEVRSREYFLEIEKSRYQFEYHIPEVLSWIDWKEKQVLEIGTGVGTDARYIISRGGQYTGINVDQGSVNMTQSALHAFSLPGKVLQSSATSLPFEDNSFDIVYCFGVLMCIPDAEKAVSEIQRVLKPGGELIVMLYNRSSINYYIEILFLRKLILRLLMLPGSIALFGALGFPRKKLERHLALYRKFGKMNDQEWLNRNTDGPDNPYSQVHDKREAEQLFSGFTIKRHSVFFFDPRHWGVLGRVTPFWVKNALGRWWGWHRMLHLAK